MAKNIYGFNEPKPKRSILSVLEVLIIIICAISIVGMVASHILFSKDGAMPKILGKNVFITYATNMEPKIPANSAVFSDPDSIDKIAVGSVVLCTVSNETASANVILRVQQVLEDESGNVSYILKGDTNPANETIKVSKDNIVGLCVRYSKGLGTVLSFAVSPLGILCAIIIPCILIIVFQVIHIIKVKNEDYDEYDDDDTAEIDEDDNVLFSTSNADDDYEERPVVPVNKLYVQNEGKAQFSRNAVPNSNSQELNRSLYNAGGSPLRRPSEASRQTESARMTVSDNFRQKPAAVPQKSAVYEDRYSASSSNTYSKEDLLYQPPKVYYEKTPAESMKLDPPAVENPVSVTIPSDAVMPRETIAPPPKKANNKTVEELMSMIDRAQNK